MNIRPYVVCHVFAGLNGRIDGDGLHLVYRAQR